MTLREALTKVEPEKVYKLINKKDSRNIAKCDRPTLDQTISQYTPVLKELLGKPKTKAYSMPLVVQECTSYDKEKYIDVCLLNPKYVAPAKGLKPWGGKNPPKGHYNVNLNKHSHYFAMGGIAWSKLIDTPIINEAKCSLEQMVAEILWEFTFYGWTEKKANKKMEDIKERINKARDEIKKGKCIEIPPKKNGGFKIVIPDSVCEEMKNVFGKKKK